MNQTNTVDEARRRGVCRVCELEAGPRRIDMNFVDPFVYDYGREYAHASCIGRPAFDLRKLPFRRVESKWN